MGFLLDFLLQRLKQPSAHSRTQEDEDRQWGHKRQCRKLFHHSTGNNMHNHAAPIEVLQYNKNTQVISIEQDKCAVWQYNMCHLYVFFDSVLTVSEFAKEFNSWSAAEAANLRLSCGDRQNFICCCFLCVLQEVVRQKIRRQLTKQQKAAQRRRLQKGEANLVTKSRRENENTIKSSVESASFWGWMGLQRWTFYDSKAPLWPPLTGKLFNSFRWTHMRVGKHLARACVQHLLNVDNLILQNHMKADSNVLTSSNKTDIKQQHI